MQKTTKNNKGFTLVELIVVIAILGVLAAVLVPQYIQYVEKSKIATEENAMKEIAHAVEIAIAEESVYSSLPASNFSVAYTDKANAVAISPDNSTLSAELAKSIVNLPFDFTSKTHNTQTATITVTYDSNNKSYKVGAPTFAETKSQPAG